MVFILRAPARDVAIRAGGELVRVRQANRRDIRRVGDRTRQFYQRNVVLAGCGGVLRVDDEII